MNISDSRRPLAMRTPSTPAAVVAQPGMASVVKKRMARTATSPTPQSTVRTEVASSMRIPTSSPKTEMALRP